MTKLYSSPLSRITKFFFIILIFISFSGKTFSQNNSFTPIGPFGGHISSLAVDPQNKDIMYAGVLIPGENDRLYKTTDRGKNWFLLCSFSSIISIEINLNYSNKIIIISSKNIYKSFDGGTSWNTINIRNDSSLILYGGAIINENNYDCILVFGRYSATIADEFIPTYRLCIFKSIDGGENWSEVTIKECERSKYMLSHNNCIAIDRNSNKYLCVIVSLNNEYFFHRSTDGGSSWSEVNVSSNIISTQQLPALTIGENEVTFLCTYEKGIFKSTDIGDNWKSIEGSPSSINSMKSVNDNPEIMVGCSYDTIYISYDSGFLWKSNLNNS